MNLIKTSILILFCSVFCHASGFFAGGSGGGGGVTDHGALTGLLDDDHTQYGLLAGRAGGQTFIGGTASGNNLVLDSTSDVTNGQVQVATGNNMSVIDGDLILADPTNTIRGENNAVADASAAENIQVSGGNKTAGTGNGGNIVLNGGTSAGGLQGSVSVSNGTDLNLLSTGNPTSTIRNNFAANGYNYYITSSSGDQFVAVIADNADAAGTSYNAIELFGQFQNDGADAEALTIQYEPALDEFFIATFAAGTGTAEPLWLGYDFNQNIRLEDSTSVEVPVATVRGDDAATGSALTVRSGDSSGGAGSALTVRSGNGTTSGGNTLISGGSGTTTGGNVSVRVGDGATDGEFTVQDPSGTTYLNTVIDVGLTRVTLNAPQNDWNITAADVISIVPGGNLVLTPGGPIFFGTDEVWDDGVFYAPEGDSTTITADNQVLSVLGSSYQLSSDSAVATDRTFVLSDPPNTQQGALLILRWTGTDPGELEDTGNACLSATWIPTDFDTLSLVWAGAGVSCWTETARSIN